MKYSKFGIAVLAAFLAGGCSTASAANMEKLPGASSYESYRENAEESLWGTDFAVSAVFGKNSIILFEPSSKEVLNEIPIMGEANKIFISMTDAQNGYMLYCGMPDSGQTQTLFYVTKDRWQTYSKMDISSTVDGYPDRG